MDAVGGTIGFAVPVVAFADIFHTAAAVPVTDHRNERMVYPFDVATGSELTNSSMTENGFRLDLAKSRYLKVNIKREVLKDSADGLVEDTRFNGPAKDGAEYTNEGIYTITVHNEYTNQFTVKKIYVGTNNILRAYMTTGLSIPEIFTLINPAQNSLLFLTSISIARIDMVKAFPPDGHMSIINLRICSTLTASILFLILFLGKTT